MLGKIYVSSIYVSEGLVAPSASAIVQIDSTTQGFLPPRMTTVQRDAIVAPSAGLVVYDVSLGDLYFFDGFVWVSTSGGGGGASSLQQAYEAGNVIFTSLGDGLLTFVVGSGAPFAVELDGDDFTVDGPGQVVVGGTVPVLNFILSASAAVSLTSAGALSLVSATADWQASGALTIDSSGGPISIGGDVDAQPVNIATGAAARDVTIGNLVGSSRTAIRAGTGASSWTMTGAGTFDLVAGTGTVNLASNATDHATLLGSVVGASPTTIRSGSGNLNLTSPNVVVGTQITIPNTGLHILDSDASHDLILVPRSNLAADRTLGWITGDASRDVDLTGAQGSIYYTDASGNLVPLGPGTSGYFLRSLGVGANPDWADVAGFVSLQDAYEGGSTITTTSSGGSIVFILDAVGTSFNVEGPNQVLFGNNTPVLDFFVYADDTISFSSFNGDVVVEAANGSFTVNTTLGIDLNASGGPLNIGTDADAYAINLGTGLAARTITVGNTTGATALVLSAGTGASSWTMTGAGTFDLVAGTGAVNLASNATDHATLLGSVVGASPTTIRSGSGNLNLTSPNVVVGTQITVPNTGLHILDSDASHDLILVPRSNLAADRTLGWITGDASRDVDLTGAQGSVYYTDASGNLVPLGPGTSGYFLRSYGVGANPAWDDVAGFVSLQDAYEGGSTITTTLSGGSIVFILDAVGTSFNVEGPNQVLFGNNTPVLDFFVYADDTISFSSFNGDVVVEAANGSFTVNTTLGIDLNASGGPLNIGTDADAYAINLGTGLAARTITVGNTTGATALVLNAGTGASSWTMTGAGTFDLVAGTGTVNLASNATDHATLLGSVVGASPTTIRSGSGNLNLTSPNVVVGTQITVPNTGLHILDSDASHDLIFVPRSNLAADRTLGWITGDASRDVDLTGAEGSIYYTDASGNLVPLGPGTSGRFLKTQGAAAPPVWDAVGGVTKGTATADFGASALGTEYVEIVVTGQASILAGADITVTMMAEATADHNAYEASLVPIRLTAGDIVAGTGFTIKVFSDWLLNGEFTVRWSWSN